MKFSGVLVVRPPYCFLSQFQSAGDVHEALLYLATLPTGSSLLDGFKDARYYFEHVLGKRGGDKVTFYGSDYSNDKPSIISVLDNPYRALDAAIKKADGAHDVGVD